MMMVMVQLTNLPEREMLAFDREIKRIDGALKVAVATKSRT